MRVRSLYLLALGLTTALLAVRVEALPSGGTYLYRCGAICGGKPCDTFCTLTNGTETTCGAYYGAPPNDLDSDGIPNSSDNCDCVANVNQANCDGDSAGDACDSTDNSWTKISGLTQTCHIDVDNHAVYETMEIYGKDIYQSGCTGATCVKKVQIISFNCYPNASMSCCTSHWLYSDCGLPWEFDACGQPRCPF